MPIPSETVALPIVRGVDLTTDLRLLQAPSLLEAVNTQFAGGGAKKRRGHTKFVVRNEGSLTATSGFADTSEYNDLYWTDRTENVDTLLGVASRDDETVLWDGVQLYSYLPSQSGTQAPFVSEISPSAVLPSLNAQPIYKVNEAQSQPQMADNGTTRILVWKNAASACKYAVLDSVSGSLVASGTFAVTTADYFRAFTLGTWMHVMVRDDSDDVAKLFSINSAEPNDVTYRSYGPATAFDLWKMSETEAVLAKVAEGNIELRWIAATGGGSITRTNISYTPVDVITPTRITVAHSPVNDNRTCVAWYGTRASDSAAYTTVAVFDDTAIILWANFASTDLKRITVAPKEQTTASGYDRWDLYWDDGTNTYVRRHWLNDSLLSLDGGAVASRYRQILASRAFSFRDRTFVWAGHDTDIQATWFLLDEGLLPVGKMDFGVANVDGISTNGHLAGVNWYGDIDDAEFHLALDYKLRVAPDDSAQAISSVYTEPTPKAVYLDFLPSLRSAQAGRTLYIAGAQLWSYDGQELVEAGFHTGPEPTYAQSAGGALTALGSYSYRVDLCHRNAQNEEVRSLSILSDTIELTGGNQTITLTIPTVLTRRTNSYFLVYRNAMEDGVPLTNWWLVNSRDPTDATYRANDLSSSTVTLIDAGAVSDTVIQTRELHPSADSYLQPISAPACEIIAAGRDRLWVAGGELLPGELAPSRLFSPGETPSFNAYLNIQVDRSNEPVTAIGFVGEVGVFFRPNSTYLIDSDGPDNTAIGSWNSPRLALADVGAQSQESIARIASGLIFQSPAGFRVLGPGGALSPIGVPVDTAVRDFDVVGVLVMERDSEVRFYGASETWVYNYLYDTWARWTCGGVGVARDPSGMALIARDNGELWIEDESTYSDGGASYTHRIRTAWLSGGALGDFQRVRRVGGIGRFGDSDLPDHTVRLELYYDQREFWEDRHEWTLPDSTTNEDTWGAATWGAGVWGDTSATISNLEDLTWDWQRDPAIQKCNAISISIEDVNTSGPGFVLSAITLELARKPGLHRGPERTGTGSYRS